MTSTAPQEDLLFSALSEDRIAGAVKLSREASWPHRPEDWSLALSVSSGLAILDGAEVVGTAMRSDFGDVATLSMIIVDARMRGCGLGRQLMQRAMNAAGARELRLVATADGLPLYEKMGFRATGQILQHQGIVRPDHMPAPECPVEVVEGADLERLAAMDLAASGMERGHLLSRIAEIGKVLLVEGGFGMLRPFGRGYVVGPIVTREAVSARALMAAAAGLVEGQFLRLDMPESVAQAAFAENLGLEYVGGGTSMVRGSKTRPSSEFKTFGLAAQSLG